jgi:hypothetical protein
MRGTVCDAECYLGPIETAGVGICHVGRSVCEDEVLVECRDQVLPEEEVCDNIDNDCNGRIDDGLPANGRCGHTTGACVAGIIKCVAGSWDCVGYVGPEDEVCDGIDNDCDGVADELGQMGYCYDGDPNDLVSGGDCHAGLILCIDGAEQCHNQKLPTHETCDGIDNDCNGLIDDGITDMTDTVFVIDASGSMGSLLGATIDTAEQFMSNFVTTEDHQFGLVIIPDGASPGSVVISDVAPAVDVMPLLSGISANNGGSEPSYDVLYDIATDAISIGWRDGASKYIVLFSDEYGQSFAAPPVTEIDAAEELADSGIVTWVFTSPTAIYSYTSIAAETGGTVKYLSVSIMMIQDMSGLHADECY